MNCIVGIDIGTTSTIGILISLPDKVLATATRPVTFFAPHPGWAEENPSQWWENVCEILPELMASAGIDKSDICGVGVTGMLPAVVLLDRKNHLLRPSIQQSDGRCGEEVRQLAREIPEAEFIKKAGNGINQQLVAAKLRWIEKNEPQVFSCIDTVFGSYDYINWRLTNEKAVEQNWALEAGFMDLSNLELSDELIALGHIKPTVVPRKIGSHEVLGTISDTAAAETGLPSGIPVVGGAADHIASGYAAGITSPGDVLLKFGGSTDILIATQKAVPDPRMFLDLHLIPGAYMPNGCMASGGSALNWFVKEIASGENAAAQRKGVSLHQHLDQISAKTPPGADGVSIIPYFLGEKTPIHDPEARGMIHGLSLNHNLRHMWRALLEGFGYAFRHHIEVFNDMGHPTNRYLASDGGSKSLFWIQICADILQQPIQLLKGHPGSCLGAAWMAAIGAGLTQDWNGVTKYVSYGDIVSPNPAHASIYDDGYQRFRSSYLAMANVEKQLKL
ncbi:MAG: FGGY-family carbohydrate kinase [Deltaproteobacteria bacterium]|jgi:xylulokinase|nr:FGGY-family carbohydrate kinase [Deltaproteobacteria bacterium]MBT4265343.1 FGGY-family carbohydrate kinase [Deltaproteobacteria bacterium]MBT4638797.1 FGGY-family carbohydrate kinase [Deltaproteobacteria bacterium]MBT6502197.1 FGGY-family carbohydrate kinase [Deltaproteobacteria bacterium]MBT7151242.1 FGGY-family carbohydrate kinase [Deltaproteobacteria bacterium]